MFLNGEYWTEYYLREKYNEKNLAERFGLNKDNIVIVKNGENTDRMNEGFNPYTNIFSPNISASTEEEFYDAYDQLVDIQSYIDFVSLNHYLCNADISDSGNNTYIWHTIFPEGSGYGDGRWNFISYDMDYLMIDSKEGYEFNLFTDTGCSKPINEWSLWNLLKGNTVFRKQFALSYMDTVNTTFSEEFVSEVLNQEGVFTRTRKKFFEKRAEYAVPQVAEALEISETAATVTLSSNKDGSPITLNTITPDLDGGVWQGQYFTAYPVTVSANEDGFIRFEVTANGKTVSYTENTIEVPVSEGGVSIRAIYR